MSHEEEDTCVSYDEQTNSYMSCEEDHTWVSYAKRPTHLLHKCAGRYGISTKNGLSALCGKSLGDFSLLIERLLLVIRRPERPTHNSQKSGA